MNSSKLPRAAWVSAALALPLAVFPASGGQDQPVPVPSLPIKPFEKIAMDNRPGSHLEVILIGNQGVPGKFTLEVLAGGSMQLRAEDGRSVSIGPPIQSGPPARATDPSATNEKLDRILKELDDLKRK